MWERACSRKRRVSQYICRLIHRFREQARSHSFKSQGFRCLVVSLPRPTPRPALAGNHRTSASSA
ncbi:hypothetical protein CGA21_06115 [Pseudomonas sp. PSB11]|nr:hypothetical protein [Pseudomonas sp. PSB11]